LFFAARLILHVSLRRRVPRLAPTPAIACPIACTTSFPASAEAPHPTTVATVESLATPAPGKAVAVIPSESDVELTGDAVPGYFSVYDDGEVDWVPG
jgi:hypothetical protein